MSRPPDAFVTERRDRIIALVRQGKRLSAISKAVGCSACTVWAALDARGFSPMYVSDLERAYIMDARKRAFPALFPPPPVSSPAPRLKSRQAQRALSPSRLQIAS